MRALDHACESAQSGGDKCQACLDDPAPLLGLGFRGTLAKPYVRKHLRPTSGSICAGGSLALAVLRRRRDKEAGRLTSFSSSLDLSRPPASMAMPPHGSAIVRRRPDTSEAATRWGASLPTARPQLRLPAPWKLTRANGHGSMARRGRRDRDMSHCARPGVRVRGRRIKPARASDRSTHTTAGTSCHRIRCRIGRADRVRHRRSPHRRICGSGAATNSLRALPMCATRRACVAPAVLARGPAAGPAGHL